VEAIESTPELLLAYVTGRHLALARAGIAEVGLPPPDWFVCDVGTSIYHRARGGFEPDQRYRAAMKKAFGGLIGEQVRAAIGEIDGIELQEEEKQGDFKVSYYTEGRPESYIDTVRSRLDAAGADVNLVTSFDPVTRRGLVDVLPAGVAKDYAVRYLHDHSGVDEAHLVYAGDSGNDRAAMLAGYRVVVVGNADPTLKEDLTTESATRGISERIYFAEHRYARGVLEGLRHFGFLALLLALAGLGCRSSQSETRQAVEVETKEVPATEQAPAVSEPPTTEKAPPPPPSGQPDPRIVYRVPLDGTEPQRGPDDALMTIVEFGDFQCPFCRHAEPIMAQILERYGEDIRIVWLNFPQDGHPHARPAATAALEAQAQKGDAAFWKMHDMLFANPGAMSRPDLERYAERLGLDLKKLRHALDTDKYAEVIDRQSALARKLGVPGTPSWYMNGRFMAGFPFETWAFTIDRRLPSVRRAVEQGVPKSELYDRIVATGKPSL
jgi:HAD superfamily hydrolase (TIGR01484 family)